MKFIKKSIYVFGLCFSLASLIMYLRIFIIISMGYRYIAYESNPLTLYFEIFIVLISIIIMFGLAFEVIYKKW